MQERTCLPGPSIDPARHMRRYPSSPPDRSASTFPVRCGVAAVAPTAYLPCPSLPSLLWRLSPCPQASGCMPTGRGVVTVPVLRWGGVRVVGVGGSVGGIGGSGNVGGAGGSVGGVYGWCMYVCVCMCGWYMYVWVCGWGVCVCAWCVCVMCVCVCDVCVW